MKKAVYCILFLAILALALGFRTARLDLRPMHHDEANQAVKFGSLLERGEYRYDRLDHHGPTLYYLTLPGAWLRSQKTLADLDEWTLRLVPAVFGAGVICLFALLAKGIGREAVLLAGLFTAVSPAAVYFSRFYIQEPLFAFFSLGFAIALGRYTVRPGWSRALGVGLLAGLAFATKETCVVVFAAACAAAWAARVPSGRPVAAGAFGKHALAAAGAALLTGVVFYSSFFSHFPGIPDSFKAFGDYAARAAAGGPHAHPWHYYLSLLAWSPSGRLLWTEGIILVLACLGSVSALSRRPAPSGEVRANAAREVHDGTPFWSRYLVFYAVFVATAFSIIRIKTPWNLLPFHAGFLILAGCGAAAAIRAGKSRTARALVVAAILAGACHLGVQSWRANFVYPADPRNPYVYAQTVPDFLRLVRRVHDLGAMHPEGKDAPVKVIAGPYEQWPLPWYLRDMRRVGYWRDPATAGGFDGVAMVIASQEHAPAVEKALGEGFQAEIYGLRPEVLLHLYVERGLWNRFLLQRSR